MYDILLWDKSKEQYIFTQCNEYVRKGNLVNRLKLISDRFDIKILQPSTGVFIPWRILNDLIK